MTTPAKFVPVAVADFYHELTQSERSYTDEERACWRRLVTDARMREVYKVLKLDDLGDLGWRLFFDVAWSHAFLDHQVLREGRRRTYELLGNISKSADVLATALENLECNAAGLSEPANYHIDHTPLEDILELLREASPDRGMFDLYVQPGLYKISSLARSRGLPTPAQLVRAIANLAEELVRLRSFDGGELQPGDPILAAATAGRSSSPLAAYRRTFLEACSCHKELKALAKLSDSAMASLASVALDKEFTEAAVKKLRLRDIPR